MKIDFDRVSLTAAVTAAAGVVPTKTPSPVLEHLLLEVSGSKAAVIGTDSEIRIRHEVLDVNCSSGGAILLPAKKLSEILRECRDQRVMASVEGNIVRLSCGRTEFRIPTMSAADFPIHSPTGEQSHRKLPGNLLRKMIRRTVFSADLIDAKRPQLGGVYFEFSEPKRLTLVATDGSRMSIWGTVCESDGNSVLPGVVVPVKTLSLLERITPDSSDLVDIAYTDRQVSFQTACATVSSRLIEGRFPRYIDVVPRSHKISLDLNVGAFHGVIRQILIATDQIKRRVICTFGAGLLKLSSENENGSCDSELPIPPEIPDSEICLNPQYISEFLKTLPSESQVNVKMTDEDSPLVLSTDDGTTHLIMSLGEVPR